MVATKVDDDGIVYVWDPDRGKYLSVCRTMFLLSSTVPGNNWAMQMAGVGEASGRNAYIMPRDGTFTNATVISEQVNSQEMAIYFYDQTGTGVRHDDLRMPQTGADASEVIISGSLDWEFSEGDWIRAATKRIEDEGSPGSITAPIVCVEVAWRIN